MSAVQAFVGMLVLLVFVFALLVAAGMASAWFEIRRERREGKVPTRPAWENRAKRRALGGFRGVWATSVQKAKHPGMQTCWCGRGPLTWFPALDLAGAEDDDPTTCAGIGCAAWEAGEWEAVRLHHDAGGYARTPAPEPVG